MKITITKLRYLCFTPFAWLTLFIKGVKMKGRSYWDSLPYISKAEGSSITIGKCRFLGKETSNPLGLFHKCMISTFSKQASVFIDNGCGFSAISISCALSVTIHNCVRCGANVTIMDHAGHSEDFRSGDPSPIIIEDHVWVGSNVIIMKGVKIGRYAMIGAGAVIRNNVPPYAVVVGNPCKVIGFSKTPEEIIEFEKQKYDEAERLPVEFLQKNYEKYFLNKLNEIKQFTKL